MNNPQIILTVDKTVLLQTLREAKAFSTKISGGDGRALYVTLQNVKGARDIKVGNRALLITSNTVSREQYSRKLHANIGADFHFALALDTTIKAVSALPKGIVEISQRIAGEATPQIVLQGAEDVKLPLRTYEPASENKNVDEMSAQFIEVPSFPLLETIKETAYAASTDKSETGQFLRSIYLHSEGQTLTAVATDRNRIAIMELQHETAFVVPPATEATDVLVDAEMLRKIYPILYKQPPINIAYAFTENALHIKTLEDDERYFIVPRFTYKFYEYKKIIPKTAGRNSFVVNTEALKVAIETSLKVSEDKKAAIRIVSIADGKIKLENKAGYEATVDVIGKHYQRTVIENDVERTENVTFAAQSNFLLEALAVIDTDTVYIDFGNDKRDLIVVTHTNKACVMQTKHIIAPFNW